MQMFQDACLKLYSCITILKQNMTPTESVKRLKTPNKQAPYFILSFFRNEVKTN